MQKEEKICHQSLLLFLIVISRVIYIASEEAGDMTGRVLVAGGSGFVGKQVVQALELAGYHVDIVSR